MGIIYKIENRITHEIYIGQTVYKLQKRWLQHIREAKQALDGTRSSFPLFHRMIIKYGEEQFIPTIIEECEDSLLDEKEKYWIEYYDSYNNGYNSTCGGERNKKQHKEYIPNGQPVSEFTKEGVYITTYESAFLAAKEKGVDPSNIRKSCNGKATFSADRLWQWGKDKIFLREIPNKDIFHTKKVAQIDKKTNEILAVYESMAEAARICNVSYAGIYNVCRGKAKTSGGFIWKNI